jgi:hypothetical protein
MSKLMAFWRSPYTYVPVQLAPFVLLAIAYQSATAKLQGVRFGSVDLTQLLLMSALLTPLLSQLFSGPLFRSLQGTEDRSFSLVVATALRNTPKALAIGTLPVVVLGSAFSQAFRWDGLPAGVMLGTVFVHLLFGVTLVPAYARRRAELILLGWGGYAVAFAIAPELWWLPSCVGIALELIVLVPTGWRRLTEAQPTTAKDMIAGTFRSFAAAVPLWSIPFGLFLLNPWGVRPEIVFTAMLPALLGYQFFFAAIAAPMWRRLDYAHRQLSQLPASQAAAAIDSLGHRARRGEARVALLLVLSVLLSLPLVTGSDSPSNLVSLGTLLASCAGVVLIAQLCRLGMLGQTLPSYAIGGALLLNMLVCASLHVGFGEFLLLHFALCVAGSVVVAAANYIVWRRPEYALFWRRALAQ